MKTRKELMGILLQQNIIKLPLVLRNLEVKGKFIDFCKYNRIKEHDTKYYIVFNNDSIDKKLSLEKISRYP